MFVLTVDMDKNIEHLKYRGYRFCLASTFIFIYVLFWEGLSGGFVGLKYGLLNWIAWWIFKY